MKTRRRIKLNLSAFDKKLELSSKMFLIIMWGLTIYTFFKLPTTIPTHFNALDQADDYGNKLTLLILPIFATIIYFAITQLNKYPHIFNYMIEINADNVEKQYTTATRMLRYLKLIILILFSFIILFTYLTSIGVTKGLGFWFLPLTFGLLLTPIIMSISKTFKNKNSVA